MNYYEHHIGDFAQATSHLSFVEDAAYSRLIRKYYAEEKNLPADIKSVQRLVGARTKEEREAVANILEEFFTLEADGWHNKRCDTEIAKYQGKQVKARASAQARWDKRKPDAMRTHSEIDANASTGNDADAMRTQCEGNAHQAPSTRHQTPDIKTKDEIAASTADPVSSEKSDTAAADPIQVRSIELATLLRKRGAALQASDPRVREWASSGVTDAQALTALEAAQQRRHEQNSPQPVNAGYLDSILKASQSHATAGKPPRQSIHDQRADTIAQLTGANRNERTATAERDITGESVRIT